MELLKYLDSGSSLAQWLRLTRYPYAEMQQSPLLFVFPCTLSPVSCLLFTASLSKKTKKYFFKKGLAIHIGRQ